MSAQPSATTSVRLAPEPDTPRSVTPCVVGFATRDDERRNRLKPGVLRSASSIAPAAEVRSSADDTIVALAAVSTPVAPRDAVTVTDSVERPRLQDDAQRRGIVVERASTDSAKPVGPDAKRAFDRTTPRRCVNRPSTPRFGRRAGLPVISTVTLAPATGAPEASITRPATGPPRLRDTPTAGGSGQTA